MKPQSAKAKGRALQKWTCERILENSQGLEKDDVQSRSMGAGGSDVMLSPAARKQWPYEIECKNLARIACYEWYEQAASHGPYEPLLVIKANHKVPLVVVNAEYFFKEWRKK